MKKSLVSVILLACTVSFVSAQTQAGKLFLTGSSNLGFLSRDYTDDPGGNSYTVTQTTFNVGVGYFFNNNALIGVKLPYQHSKKEDYKTTEVAIEPFFRYYFGANQFKPFLEAGLGFKNYNLTTSGSSTTTFNGPMMGVGAGIAYYITPSVAIEAMFGYTYNKITNTDNSNDKEKIGETAFNIGFDISL